MIKVSFLSHCSHLSTTQSKERQEKGRSTVCKTACKTVSALPWFIPSASLDFNLVLSCAQVKAINKNTYIHYQPHVPHHPTAKFEEVKERGRRYILASIFQMYVLMFQFFSYAWDKLAPQLNKLSNCVSMLSFQDSQRILLLSICDVLILVCLLMYSLNSLGHLIPFLALYLLCSQNILGFMKYTLES